MEILTQLRQGDFDILVGINLLREGIDLPEVSFIAILDADKIGFLRSLTLRSLTSLVQIIGRAARNAAGKVIMYADRMSDAMEKAIAETNRRREIQIAYNKKHGITPATVKKAIRHVEEADKAAEGTIEVLKKSYNVLIPAQRKQLVKALEKEMFEHAKNLEFEQAAALRDEIEKIKDGSF